ncbi:MAG: hypothetical protein IJ144_01515 [Prevotella sp.]|nr:hypothetical protein [Prevotella sp.]MBQ9186485.1 hypothetical protein [Prevotella sp.]
MIKKEYMKPTMRVVKVQHQSHILAGSLRSVKSSGLDDEDDLLYDDLEGNGGDQGYAW